MLLFCLVIGEGAAQTHKSAAAVFEDIGAGTAVLPAEQLGGLPLKAGGADDGLLQGRQSGKRLTDAQPQGQALQFVVGLGKLFGDAAVVLHFVGALAAQPVELVQQLIMHMAADQPRQVDKVAAVIATDKAQEDFPGDAYGILA